MQPAPTAATYPKNNRKRGSAIITALIFTLIVTVGLTALFNMLLNDWKLASRVSAGDTAFTLAESGVDEAIWCVLEHVSNDSDWANDGWTESSNKAYWYKDLTLKELGTAMLEDYTLDEGRAGSIRLLVQKVEAQYVYIVSQGKVSGGSNTKSDFEVTRIIETQFRRPNPFEYGLIARDGVDFNGQPYFDSYDSRIFPYSYSSGINSGENATVGSMNVDVSRIAMGNATIKGDLLTGAEDDGSDPFSDDSITGDVIYEFEMDLPEVVAPDTSTSGWNNSL